MRRRRGEGGAPRCGGAKKRHAEGSYTWPTHREDVALVVCLHSHVEQLAGGDDIRCIQPQPRQTSLCNTTSVQPSSEGSAYFLGQGAECMCLLNFHDTHMAESPACVSILTEPPAAPANRECTLPLPFSAP